MSFLALPLLLIALPTQLRTRNVPVLTILIVLFLVNIVHGINSILWAGSVVFKLPVWCDITTKLMVGAQVALPAASLCITRHLECISSVRQSIHTADDKRRRMVFDVCLCGVFPCIIMALHYIVQGHRFDIYEDFGCMPTIYDSWQAIVIITLPPLLLAMGTMVYASLAFTWFLKRRNQFAQHLQSNGSGLTSGRYTRLMAMSVTEVIIEVGFGIYLTVFSLQGGTLRGYGNWANVHSNFSRVAQYPRLLVPEYVWSNELLSWYIAPIGTLDFFIFFGIGQEAQSEYRRAFNWFTTRVLGHTLKLANDSVLPTYSAPSAPRSRTAPVRLDDLDNLSIDDKWDEDEAEAEDKPSTRPSSYAAQQEEVMPPRPLSCPPVRRLDTGDWNNGSLRSFSVDLPRQSTKAA